MESRFITGSTFIWQETGRELNKIRLFKQKEFILEKINEAQIRRKKYPISMQPNIKEGVGSLRDTQLIFWVAKIIYNVTSPKDLTKDVFTDNEYREYRIALELLYRVRSALHLITKKQDDRLSLELMPQIASMLGFKDVKKLATKVLEAGWRINNFTQIFVKKMVRQFIVEHENISKFRAHRLQKGIYLHDERIFASYNLNILPIDSLLKLLIELEDKDYKFDAGFLRQFTYVNIKHPLSDNTYELLKKLFYKQNTYSFLKLFYDAGILHQLFSNFKKVLHLPQFDGYHTYPVDLHSIKCVEAFENIKDPFIQELHDTFSKEEKLLLKLVVLSHDTGKGRKQDHSEVGAKLIVQMCSRFNISQELTSRAVTLVKHHILMSSVAFKENIHNEKVLYRFMSHVGDTKNLQLLYVLTYADIGGVANNIYNSFNSSLLKELYIGALEVSENTGRITDAKKRVNIEKKVQKRPEFLELPPTLRKKILRIESNLFFFKHSPADIVSIAKRVLDTKQYSYSFKVRKITFLQYGNTC